MATTTLAPRATAYQRSRLYEWLTTTDHKKIGVMYMVTAFLLLPDRRHVRAADPDRAGRAGHAVPRFDTYNQLFTIHGTVMIFLFVMPMWTGLAQLHRAAPGRRRRHGLPAHQCAVLLDGAAGRHPALLGLCRGRRGERRLDRLRAAVGAQGRGIDLWLGSLVLLGTSSDPGRDQLHRHDLQDARAGHDADAHAAVRLEHARHERAAALLRARPHEPA
jgi:hypothetical protein